MSRKKGARRRLDTALTVLGYSFLALGLWCIWLGIGILVHWALPGADDAEPIGEWISWWTPVAVVLYAGLGVGFVGVGWWLSGEPIRRWWWRRRGQTGQPDPQK